MFSTGQLKNVFADFEICKHYNESNLKLHDDKFIRRITYNINSIIHSLIQFDRYEKGDLEMFVDEYNYEGFEIMAHHENLFNRLRAIMRYSYWLFEVCFKTEVNNYKEIIQILSLTNEINENEKTILSLGWYSNIEAAFKSIMTEGKLKAYAENNVIKFQIFDDEKKSIIDYISDPVIKNDFNMLTECPVIWIHSKIYFSTCLLHLLKYLEVLSKYCCIQAYSKYNYENYKKENETYKISTKNIEIKPEENTLAIIKVLSEIPKITINCLNFGKIAI